MPERLEPDCGPLPDNLFPALRPSFHEGLMDIRNPEVLRSEIVNLVRGQSGYEKIDRAMQMAFKAHKGQTRLEGKQYIIHPLRVAWRLIQYWEQVYGCLPAAENLYIALLHDVLEDSRKVSEKNIERVFGEGGAVIRGVKTLTKKYKHGKIKGKAPKQYFQGIASSSANIKIIKILDRTDNIRSLSHNMPPRFISKQLVETRNYVMPIAREFPLLCNDLSDAMAPFGSRRGRRRSSS